MKRHATGERYRETIAAAMKAKKLHNLDLKKSDGAPGIEHTLDNALSWWLLGKLEHRTDGPALRHRGYDKWMAFGRQHRVGGPAEIMVKSTNINMVSRWWLYGVAIDSWEEYQGVTECSDADLTALILKWGTTDG